MVEAEDALVKVITAGMPDHGRMAGWPPQYRLAVTSIRLPREPVARRLVVPVFTVSGVLATAVSESVISSKCRVLQFSPRSASRP